MYPQDNKQYNPSAPAAPPSYTDSMAQSQPQPTHVIVVQGPSIPPLGPRSVQLTCPACKTLVTTRVEEEASSSAYMCCMVLFVVGCCLFSCLPFCMDNFKNCNHSCPRCNAFIGSYKS